MGYEKLTYDQRIYNMQTALFKAYNPSENQIVFRREFHEMAVNAVNAEAEKIMEALEAGVVNHIFYSEGMSDPPMIDEDKIEEYLLKNGYVPPKNVNT